MAEREVERRGSEVEEGWMREREFMGEFTFVGEGSDGEWVSPLCIASFFQ